MKSLVHKLLAFTFVIALFSGCASVTGNELAQPQDQNTEVVTNQGNDIDMSTEQDMTPIYDKPK